MPMKLFFLNGFQTPQLLFARTFSYADFKPPAGRMDFKDETRGSMGVVLSVMLV